MCGFFCLLSFSASAQCPDNIDFERGDFTGWKAWIGWHYLKADNVHDTVDVGVQVPPQPTRHMMMSSFPGDGKDPYGGFSRNCPNGSGHSVRLGLDSIGRNGISMAQGLSYEFTIAPGQNNFNLVYNYAIVVQNSGTTSHTEFQQACFVIEVKNITDNVVLSCTSFNFHATSGIPGFYPSTEDTTVKCKDWAQGFINLENLEGKTIQLFFKTATCTPSGHWGYAYIDVNTSCSSAFTGATYCKGDTAVVVTAPSGFANYHWYSLTNPNLGDQQTITIKPPPVSGDSAFVDIFPYKGYGCTGTLKAYFFDTLTLRAYAGMDKSGCYGTPFQLGGPAKPDLKYKWSPATGLSNPSISSPVAKPDTSTQYILTVTSSAGGCAVSDTVNVNVEILSDSIELIGDADFCINSGKSAALKVLPADSIQWYKDGVAIPGANQTILNITQTGAYYAAKFSNTGCSRNTPVKQINIDEIPVTAFSVNKNAQCFAGNNFIFTNYSTISTGTLNYRWNMGNGTTFTTDNVIYSYPLPGNYTVTLTAAAPGGCKKDSAFNVIVYPKVMAAFAVDKSMQCFKDNAFSFTNQSIVSGTAQYIWNLGDGMVRQTKDVIYNYTQPGAYLVKLTATGQGGCSNDSSVKVTVNPSPVVGFTVNDIAQCFPGHQFILTNTTALSTGTLKYVWNLGDGTIKDTTAIVYSYARPGAYTIKLLANTDIGCADSLQKDVNVYPTPTADFTIRPVCEDLQVPVINRTLNNTNSTVNYLWNFDNGHTDNAKSPIYSYPAAGNYSVMLTVSTVQCPASFDTKTVDVTIDKPLPGMTYADKDAAFNFPEQLQARSIGTSVTWSPATNLNNRFSYTPTFTGIALQLYTIAIKTVTGCITVDTQLVKTHKKIEIYVPNAFTPDGNGTNERLRPVLIGFTKVNYFNVYNRYGQLLFTMASDQPGWDGKIQGKPADTQTVVWMIEAVDVDGVVHTKKGSTVLYR